jgi:proteasome lid subunit RPN8/RPN11
MEDTNNTIPNYSDPKRPRSWGYHNGFTAEFKLLRLREIKTDGMLGDCPEQIYRYWLESVPGAVWYNPEVECMVCFFLNTRRRLTGFHLVSMGTMDTLLVHPREVFKTAIIQGAAAIVVAHNHPSGDPTPSECDIKVTRDLIRAGQLLKIDVCDHLIIGKMTADRAQAYLSLRELGYFYT